VGRGPAAEERSVTKKILAGHAHRQVPSNLFPAIGKPKTRGIRRVSKKMTGDEIAPIGRRSGSGHIVQALHVARA
jgi:hypothetical protein